MILGRTTSGAIKIKTDGTAGLRAVNCACCAPTSCEDYSFSGIIITKENYNNWLKGGTIEVSGSVFDTSYNGQYQIDQGCPNGTCAWSYSNTNIIVPPNTCVFELRDSGPSVSCSSSYYGENQRPGIFLQARAFKSKDEVGEVYRARLWLTISCPHLLWFNPCIMDICNTSTLYGLGNTAGFIPDYMEVTVATLSFLGAQFQYVSQFPSNETTPARYSNLAFTFTPNP